MNAYKLSAVLTFVAVFAPIAQAGEMAEPQSVEATWEKSAAVDQRRQRYMDALTWSQIEKTPPEGMGFHRPESIGLPAEVSEAAQSVFTIANPAGDLREVSDPQMTMQKMAQLPVSDDLDIIDREVISTQIRNCLKKPQVPCYVFPYVSYSTAFVTGDSMDLRTAAHAIQDLDRHSIPSPLPLFLVDGNGKIVKRPEDLDARVSRRVSGDHQIENDQIVVRVKVPLAKPIPIASDLPKPGEPIYLVGVPKKTEDRAQFSAVDGDGMSIRVTHGTVLGFDQLKARAAKTGFDLRESELRNISSKSIASTADGAPHFSGAAMLNAHGEVVGVYTRGMPESGDAWPFRISYGTRGVLP